MLDTVVLNFDIDKFKIKKSYLFRPDAEGFLKTFGQGKAINNPTKADFFNVGYSPRMTLYKRPSKMGFMYGLRIEFSAPKILYQNNLDELKEDDFEELINTLQKRIENRGVYINKKNLINANVSVFHPSKNIELNNYTTATMVLRDLAKVDLTRRLDLTKTIFPVNGESLQYYSNSHSFVFYDKIADMKKPSKRAIDKENNPFQKSLFAEIKEVRKFVDVEILRMEVRLTNKRKMNKILTECGFKESPKFKGIFKKEDCQKILQKYWQDLVLEKNKMIFLKETNNKQEAMIKFLIQARKKGKKQAKALNLWLLSELQRDQGMVLINQIIEDVFGAGSRQSIQKQSREINNILEGDEFEFNDYVNGIEMSLEEFKVIKKEQFNDVFNLFNN
jgi:hypothetical protein